MRKLINDSLNRYSDKLPLTSASASVQSLLKELEEVSTARGHAWLEEFPSDRLKEIDWDISDLNRRLHPFINPSDQALCSMAWDHLPSLTWKRMAAEPVV